ncbi:FGGY-family carbohydrate kinase [Phyllobacterium leguminum]|uniref:Sugar (Pentulose or hexulose) kinase n=1 Tax=Phyllobacterium leguminum TaxID=314237 RepID=A0A318T2C9_9HYPH|nr:FGGY-family carbohydrate kinase [Phyllobacterium leguminum]PYE88009.1 sugar (pentulose or hexulose) kinase [Phyllobacterium leguminum]
MTFPSHIAVLDVGKTNAKAVIVDSATGAEIATRTMPNRVLSGPPYPHYDIETLWRFFLTALTEFTRTPGFDAISITTHGASAALLKQGQEKCEAVFRPDLRNNKIEDGLAMPVLDYEHAYPDDIREHYAALRPDFSETASPLLSGGLNLGAQLHYQKTAFPNLFARVHTILTYPQYWAWRLTGIAACETTSLGCHTDLWNPHTGCVSSLVDTLEIAPLLAPVRSAFDVLSHVLPEIATQIGLDHPIPVHCGIHDSNASLLPHLIQRKPPFAVVSTGTWVVIFGVGGRAEKLDSHRDTLINVDAYGRPVPSARFMGGREFEMLMDSIAPVHLEKAIEALPDVVCDQTMVLPSVIKGTGPFPTREMAWLNAENLTPAKRYAAAALYAALMTEVSLDLVGADGPIIIEGPFARNSIYTAALGHLTGREMLALPGSTGTSLGAAMLAGMQPGASTPEPNDLMLPQTFEAYAEKWRSLVKTGAYITPSDPTPHAVHAS